VTLGGKKGLAEQWNAELSGTLSNLRPKWRKVSVSAACSSSPSPPGGKWIARSLPAVVDGEFEKKEAQCATEIGLIGDAYLLDCGGRAAAAGQSRETQEAGQWWRVAASRLQSGDSVQQREAC